MAVLYTKSFGDTWVIGSTITVIQQEKKLILTFEQIADDENYFGEIRIKYDLWYNISVKDDYEVVGDQLKLPRRTTIIEFVRSERVDNILPEDLFEIVYDQCHEDLKYPGYD